MDYPAEIFIVCSMVGTSVDVKVGDHTKTVPHHAALRLDMYAKLAAFAETHTFKTKPDKATAETTINDMLKSAGLGDYKVEKSEVSEGHCWRNKGWNECQEGNGDLFTSMAFTLKEQKARGLRSVLQPLEVMDGTTKQSLTGRFLVVVQEKK